VSDSLNDRAKYYVKRQVEKGLFSTIKVVDKITCIFIVNKVDHEEEGEHHNKNETIEHNRRTNYEFIVIGEKEHHFRLTEK
jgi:GTP1/Obg family GTP-binding protein